MADVRPLAELQSTGLLWLVNRVVFHPRGFALGLAFDAAGSVIGWELLGDGSGPWAFGDDEGALFARANVMLQSAAVVRAGREPDDGDPIAYVNHLRVTGEAEKFGQEYGSRDG